MKIKNEKDALRAKLKIAKLTEANKKYEATHRIEFFKPYWYQSAVTDAFRNGKNIVIQPFSNKVGKSCVGACLVHSWAMGYEPWNPVPDTFKGGVRVGEKFFMPSSLGKKPPVKIRITGEDWEKHLEESVIPELKRWAIKGDYKITKNNVGVEASWMHTRNGSTFDLMTYRQDPDLYESWLGHGWWPDEPPTKPIWSAMSRALFMTGGKIFMSMTPLKEPWIFDELIHSGRPDIFAMEKVSLWDCPHLYDNDVNVLMKCGLTEEQAKEVLKVQKQEARETKDLPETEQMLKDMIGVKTVKFMDEFGQELERDALNYAHEKLYIHRFVKDLEDDTERIPRCFGEPKHLMGTVWKGFDTNVHVVKPFKIPPDWPVEFQIDFHINKPHAVMFYAIDPYDRIFVFHEIWENETTEELGDDILRERASKVLRMEYGEIDPLSKGDDKYVKNRLGDVESSYEILRKKLEKYGVKLGVGSKDEKSYIRAVESRLKGANGLPSLFVFNTCKETIKQIKRWTWETLDEGHFPECLGRATQTGLKYKPYRKAKPKPDNISVSAFT